MLRAMGLWTAAVPTAEPSAAGAALRRHGAVLIDGVALEDFERLAEATWQTAGYGGLGIGDYNAMGSVTRPMVSAHVYDVAAGAPPEMAVAPHSEQAYLFHVPRFAAFRCQRSAAQGGELQLFDNVRLAERLGPLAEKLQRLGVSYQRLMGDKQKTPGWSYPTGMWQDRFNTEDWQAAQRLARENFAFGGPRGAELRALDDGLVLMNWTVPAVTLVNTSLETSSRAVLQSILDSHRSTNYGDGIAALDSTWGDGSVFEDEELEALRRATAEALAVQLKLQPGQVVVIDNWRFAHGRLPYKGLRSHAALISDRFRRVQRPASVEL